VPDFVKREFEPYLDCGLLEKGFTRYKCSICGAEKLAAHSCKGRSFCPSCGGRYMTALSMHLVDRVLPLNAPIRHWVYSMPFSLRYMMGYDKKLCASILSVYAFELR
jgi:hypothetical protein